MGRKVDAPSRLHAVARYALATVLVALALLISLALQNSFGNPFWFFFSVAVILSTVWSNRTGLAFSCLQHTGRDVLLHAAHP